ncbi:ATP-binding cassette subfamily C protein CydC [Gibbsiella quercinecans]|uniref:Glutathione/L-cysteine transport system ATP-binding/permease protein CydC n=1 Tax=Gibbsiella quercinecans TaxID=929813 RepID=A0A250B5L5_9GAMM|nr:cysteine/glutathione ABC transporter ATP-binding protein/permease CydC [Gibbsiella quercinecans]ATA21459.1 cysteine/glutathione ABC transporter ATP-binding protein/permease CydC [Gibbsiella quercinecans]RLM07916.1 cysteine/glutathione ABC transporter ATP-binding protein/permease CydC [Gibbsiella quercinecans]RLM09656.1 cysteine/glutathione ABC transporter ATP-binding protein/permease CydC [Gibbsiella quercinecans]TCT84313.1 ATP-binding cassette subfamily C protein CydC [Gibbsiella quercineca
MRVLLPFLALYRRHTFLISLGIILAIITLLASIGLLALSGWFLAASALAGLAGLFTFNYMLPAAGVRGAAIFRTAGRYAERVVSHDATFRVLAHLRVFTFQKILPLSPGGIARFRQAELLNRLVADVDTLDHLYLRVISPLVSAAVVIAVVTAGLSLLDTGLALTLGAILLLLLLLIPPVFYRAGKPIGAELTALRGQYRTDLAAWLQGQAELVVFGAAESFRAVLNATEQRWQQRQWQQTSLGGLAQALLILASGLTVTLLLWLAAAGIGGNTQPGALIALFVFAGLAAFEAMMPIAGAFQHLGQVVASATRVKQIIDRQPEVCFPAQGANAAATAALSLRQVDFTYPGQPQPVLRNITLDVAPGEHIALLGRTGCGKSTLLQLLTRAWDIDSGSISLNGQPLASYSESTLRAMTTVVNQRVHVFSSTLRENLQLAAPGATDAQFNAVLHQVGLDKLLENEGLNAWLGEGGRQLSGGEQRRLGIARALLHPAPLLLLDEPTEGLDAETERQILQLLRQHCRGKTLILITHRLYGLDHFDRICVMDGGKIIEQGDHAALLRQQGRYAQFHQRVSRVSL